LQGRWVYGFDGGEELFYDLLPAGQDLRYKEESLEGIVQPTPRRGVYEAKLTEGGVAAGTVRLIYDERAETITSSFLAPGDSAYDNECVARRKPGSGPPAAPPPVPTQVPTPSSAQAPSAEAPGAHRRSTPLPSNSAAAGAGAFKAEPPAPAAPRPSPPRAEARVPVDSRPAARPSALAAFPSAPVVEARCAKSFEVLARAPIKAEPTETSASTGNFLTWGSVVKVDRVVQGMRGQRFLHLADGSGWASAKNPDDGSHLVTAVAGDDVYEVPSGSQGVPIHPAPFETSSCGTLAPFHRCELCEIETLSESSVILSKSSALYFNTSASAIALRTAPDLAADRTIFSVAPGMTVLIAKVVEGNGGDGQQFLELADGKGWAFTKHPTQGHTLMQKGVVYQNISSVAVSLRSAPNLASARTSFAVMPGESALVAEVMAGSDGRGQQFLQLADGRGWAFTKHPTLDQDLMQEKSESIDASLLGCTLGRLADNRGWVRITQPNGTDLVRKVPAISEAKETYHNISTSEAVSLRSAPDIESAKTGFIVGPGTSVDVSEIIESSKGGQQFLKIADRRGWAFTKHPTKGHTLMGKGFVFKNISSVGVSLRSAPDLASSRTSFSVMPGESVFVEDVVQCSSGSRQQFLKLADGRGWAFTKHPTNGEDLMQKES